MRLRRLDLTRYGRFTDHSIDFGAAVAGQPDLHIVYGPNEAGKSTTLAAFLDLLFGIEVRSRYNFRHPYNTMRIGAALETAAGPRTFVRLKRAQASLFDGEDRPVPDGSLLGELVGLDRAAYQAMFCLDDDTLEAGGKSILESRGELGQLLFAASSGLAELSRKLADLRAEADGFYRFNGRGGELTRLKSELSALKDERQRLDTIASEYHRLVEQRDADLGRYREALQARKHVQARMDVLQGQLSALPHVADLRRLRAELAGLGDLPAPPSGWSDELPRLLRDEVELATRAAGLDDEITRRAARLDTIAVDTAAAATAARLDGLTELRARHVTADLYIPARQGELRRITAAIAALLARLDRPDDANPARLVIPARLTTTLSGLIVSHAGIEAALEAAAREHAEAIQNHAAARLKLMTAGGGDSPKTGLRRVESAATALRTGDHQVRRRTAERALEANGIKLESQLSALRPWLGTAADLTAMTVPDASVMNRWRQGHDTAQRDEAQHAARLADLGTEVGRLDAELVAMATVLGVVSDQEIAEIRTVRETAWATHRRRLETATAETFEAALRRDDLAMVARLGHQSDLAKAQEMARTRTVRVAEQRSTEALLLACTARRDAVAAEVAAAIASGMPGLPAPTGPEALSAWLDRRATALETWHALRQAEAELRAADQDATRLRIALRDALAGAEVRFDAEAEAAALLAVAETALAGETEVRGLHTATAAAEAEVTKRAHVLQEVRTRNLAWRKKWTDACAACWLGDDGTIPEPAEAGALIAALGELGPLLHRQGELSDRINAMADDQERFAKGITAVANLVGIDANAPPLDLAQQVEVRIQAAQEAVQTRQLAAAALEESREQRRKLAMDEALHTARKAAMLDFFGVGTLDDVATRLRDAGRKLELSSRAREAAAAIAEAVGASGGEDAETGLAALSKEALQAEMQDLRTEVGHIDTRSHALYAQSQQSSERLEVVGGDDAVARIEVRRRTTLLDIEQSAAAYLRLRAGIIAAEMALRSYRDRHRSSMMTRASAAFATISRGVYERLTSRPEKDGEVLIAVGADGTSKLADDLSKGTRFQLYLALRAAGYQEFTAMHRPVPFIADDIMETFDDFRAEETFRVLGDMATSGQVIYMTHHRHLTEIARRIVPTARVHSIGT